MIRTVLFLSVFTLCTACSPTTDTPSDNDGSISFGRGFIGSNQTWEVKGTLDGISETYTLLLSEKPEKDKEGILIYPAILTNNVGGDSFMKYNPFDKGSEFLLASRIPSADIKSLSRYCFIVTPSLDSDLTSFAGFYTNDEEKFIDYFETQDTSNLGSCTLTRVK